jgi:hypothetical protein
MSKKQALEPTAIDLKKGKTKHGHPRWELIIWTDEHGTIYTQKFFSSLDRALDFIKWLFLGEQDE